MSKSIMHRKDGTCYLCMKFYDDYSTKTVQEHHAMFGVANRHLAEHFGLKTYLCLYHHTEGKEAVHNNAENALVLKQDAQRAFEDKYSHEEWMSVFGKNFIYEEEAPVQQCEDGFMFI